MILIAFENGIFPLPKQYPSSMDDWKEDEMDSSEFLPKGTDTLLPLFWRKEKTKKEETKYTGGDFNKLVAKKEKKINRKLFQEYFFVKTASQLSKYRW